MLVSIFRLSNLLSFCIFVCSNWPVSQPTVTDACPITFRISNCFLHFSVFFVKFVQRSPLSIYVHITDDGGWLSSPQSGISVYLKLLGRERQHHPEQMRLEIHFRRTRNKKLFSFLFIPPSCPPLYLTLCLCLSFSLSLSSISCLGNESASSQRSMFFFPNWCVCAGVTDSDGFLCSLLLS